MQSVLITGSSRGLGKAIAIELAKQGYSIVLHGRTETESLLNTKKEISNHDVDVRQICFDVSDREQTRKILEKDISENGIYFGVVLSAGITRDNAFPFMTDTDWDQVISTNLDSFFNVIKPIIEPLILSKLGGRIVVITSVSGILGNRGQVNYSAAKAGLIGAAKSLGLELAKRKITVNCVAPGLIRTDMTDEANMKHILPLIPMRKIGNPEDVSGVVAFLMSDKASYITRQTIAVDGGLS